eukprot:752321-Hanusia_phi.AAC.1
MLDPAVLRAVKCHDMRTVRGEGKGREGKGREREGREGRRGEEEEEEGEGKESARKEKEKLQEGMNMKDARNVFEQNAAHMNPLRKV